MDEKLLAYSRKLHLWTERFQCQYCFQAFQTEMKFCKFLEKIPLSPTDPKKKLMLRGWWLHKRIIP